MYSQRVNMRSQCKIREYDVDGQIFEGNKRARDEVNDFLIAVISNISPFHLL